MPENDVTIVSLLPYELSEKKPGLTPTEYVIKSRGSNEFSLNLIPQNAFYLVNPDLLSDAKEVKHIKVPVPARALAESIINDYISSLLAVEPPDIIPGLFVAEGKLSSYTDAKIKLARELTIYKTVQLNWFTRLVELADDSWSKSHSPIAISDVQRNACRELGYKRDWLNPLPQELISKCPVCKNPINEGALKCVSCGFIFNKAELDKLMLVASK